MRKIYYIIKHKFNSGEINLCFICGLSGSGKSSMARNIAEKNKSVEHYELDDLLTVYKFSDDNLKEYGDLIYSYFKGIGKKFRFYSQEEFIEYMKRKDEETGDCSITNKLVFSELFTSFIKYSINYSKSHKDKKYIIEGVWLVNYVDNVYNLLSPYAVYIKGTSLLISRWRASKRDSSDILNNKEAIKSRFREFTNKDVWKKNKNFDKDLTKFRNYFKNKK